RVAWTFHLLSRDTGEYRDERNLQQTRAGSGAAYVKLVYTEEGLEKEVRYLGRNNKPRPDASGIFGRRLERGQNGLVTAISFLGPSDLPVLNPQGYARITQRWDERGNLLAEAYFDLRGKPARGRFGSGIHVRWTYNEDGNPLRQEMIGLDGKVIAGTAMSYDARGNPLESRTLLAPQARPDGPPWARRTVYKYDEKDNCTLVRSLGDGGAPAANPTGVAGQAMTHDEQGREISVTYLGPDGKPTVLRAPERGGPGGLKAQDPVKVARVVNTYHPNGRRASQESYDLGGKL